MSRTKLNSRPKYNANIHTPMFMAMCALKHTHLYVLISSCSALNFLPASCLECYFLIVLCCCATLCGYSTRVSSSSMRCTTHTDTHTYKYAQLRASNLTCVLYALWTRSAAQLARVSHSLCISADSSGKTSCISFVCKCHCICRVHLLVKK